MCQFRMFHKESPDNEGNRKWRERGRVREYSASSTSRGWGCDCLLPQGILLLDNFYDDSYDSVSTERVSINSAEDALLTNIWGLCGGLLLTKTNSSSPGLSKFSSHPVSQITQIKTVGNNFAGVINLEWQFSSFNQTKLCHVIEGGFRAESSI